MLRAKILKDTAMLNAASIIGQGITIGQSLLVMRFLGPDALGVWSGLSILLTYSLYAGLGIDYALGIRLPYYQGQGNVEREIKIADTVYVAWSGITLLLVLCMLGYALLAQQLTSIERLGLASISGLILLEQQMRFWGRWQTASRKDFTLFSLLSILKATISFCIIVPLAYFFSVSGVMVGTLLVAAVMAVVWQFKTPYRLHWQLSGEVLWEMLRIGFPILLVALGGVLIQTVDRLLILRLLGTASLGYYGVTGLGGNILYGLLSQAGGAMSPHMAEAMGECSDSAPTLDKFLVKPTVIFACVAAILIMGLLFTIPPFVEWLLPQYLPGLSAFYFFVPGFFFLSIILSADNLLNVILIARRRQRWIVYIQAIAIVVELTFGVLFIRSGWGIAGVALASTLAYAVYGLTVLTLASMYIIPEKVTRLRFLADVMVPFVLATGASLLVYWVGQQWLSASLVLRLTIQLLLCGIASIPIMLWLNTRVELWHEIAPLITAIRRRVCALIPTL